MAGEMLRHSQGALKRLVRCWKEDQLLGYGVFVRECKEQGGRNHHQDPSSDVNGLVPGILEAPAGAEERVAGEVFPVLAQVTPRKMLLFDIHRPGRRTCRGQSLMSSGIVTVVRGALVLQ